MRHVAKTGYGALMVGRRLTYLFSAGLLALLYGCNGVPKTDMVLAEVNGDKITAKDFVARYQEFKKKSAVEPSGEVRRGLLQSLIDDYVLASEARRHGMDSDSLGRFEQKQINMQAVLNAYNKRHVVSNTQPQDKQLRQMYYDFNTRLQARHLFARTRQEADQLYADLQNGTSFEALAKQVFRDPRLRDSGGSLGTFSVNEMDPAFEKAAYRLKPGEVSRPVKTKNGYSIIRVDQRSCKPFLTEYDYSTNKGEVELYLRQRNAKLRVRNYVDSLKQAMNIEFNEELLPQLMRVFLERPGWSAEKENNGLNALPAGWVVKTASDSWDSQQFMQKAQFTTAQQRNWIRDEQGFKDFISGLVVRNYMLQQAEEEGLSREPQVTAEAAGGFDTFLVQCLSGMLALQMEVNADSVQAYYRAHASKFSQPPLVKLRRLVVTDMAQAKVVEQKLREGVAFTKLVEEYSIDRSGAATGGETAYLQHSDLGPWAKLAFALHKGEWAGPLKLDDGQAFIQLLDKKPARPRSFEEAQADILFALKSEMWQGYRKQKINEFKKDMQIKIYPEKLREIKLN